MARTILERLRADWSRREALGLLAAGLLTLCLPERAFAQGNPARPGGPKPEPIPPSIDRVNAYFNGIRGLQADFVQLSPDGRAYTGVLSMLRPGRLRFEYNPPSSLLIIADGTAVEILDRKSNARNEYFIGQTPLKFLLQAKIDIAKDTKVTDLKREGNDIVLILEDKNTLAGTSRIRVVFDGQSHVLKEWTVTDPQGLDTKVSLSNLNSNVLPDKDLFVINRPLAPLNPK